MFPIIRNIAKVGIKHQSINQLIQLFYSYVNTCIVVYSAQFLGTLIHK